MSNEQILALVLAALVGLIPNLILKYLDKHKSKEEVEGIEVNTLSEVLQEMREHNKFLEDKLSKKREEITLQAKEILDLREKLQEYERKEKSNA